MTTTYSNGTVGVLARASDLVPMLTRAQQTFERCPAGWLWLHGGAAIHLVQATLGHASVATTVRYLHARPTDSLSRYLAG